jgi:hypothetical protein
MRQIELTQGKFAIVDDADFAWLSQWKWTAQKTDWGFYAMRHECGQVVFMHRLINETPAGMVTDHEDGDGLNNRRGNLRTATQLQNMMNRHGKRNGTSQYKGVWADSSRRNRKPWRAAIRINGKLKYLGRFISEDEAGRAYAAAAREMFGEFARTNKRSQP